MASNIKDAEQSSPEQSSTSSTKTETSSAKQRSFTLRFDKFSIILFSCMFVVVIFAVIILSTHPNACVQYQSQSSLVCRKPFTHTYLLCATPTTDYFFGLLPKCSNQTVPDPFSTTAFNGIISTTNNSSTTENIIPFN